MDWQETVLYLSGLICKGPQNSSNFIVLLGNFNIHVDNDSDPIIIIKMNGQLQFVHNKLQDRKSVHCGTYNM